MLARSIDMHSMCAGAVRAHTRVLLSVDCVAGVRTRENMIVVKGFLLLFSRTASTLAPLMCQRPALCLEPTTRWTCMYADDCACVHLDTNVRINAQMSTNVQSIRKCVSHFECKLRSISSGDVLSLLASAPFFRVFHTIGSADN